MKVFKYIFILLFYTPLLAENYNKQYLEQILKKIDESRTSYTGLQVYIKAIEIDSKNDKKEYLFLTKTKGFFSKVVYIKPAYNKGDIILNTKTQTWYYRKGTKNPIPITKKQKLFGLASTGDVLNIAYSLEYEPSFLKEDKIKNKECIVMELNPKNNQKPAYEKIHLWIDKNNFLSIYSEYYTQSNKLLKKAFFDYLYINNKPFISKIVLIDPLIGNTKTILYFVKPELVSLSDIEFKKELIIK